jgi:hypothetical protein
VGDRGKELAKPLNFPNTKKSLTSFCFDPNDPEVSFQTTRVVWNGDDGALLVEPRVLPETPQN